MNEARQTRPPKNNQEDALRLYARKMRAWVDPADVFVTLYSRDANSFWLDREHHTTDRFTVMGHAFGNRILSATDALTLLENEHRGWEFVDVTEPPPFAWRPGLVGWFDYPTKEQESELAGRWQVVREAVVFDHDRRDLWMVGEFDDQEHFEEWVRALLLRLGLSGGQSIGYRQRHRQEHDSTLTFMAHSPAAYLKLIAKAQSHIAAGDVYQLCLTNRLEFEHQLDPLAVYLELRAANPAPYACYLKFEDQALVCSSPEQFLSVSSDGIVSSRPIKGTRPRSIDSDQDRKIAQELATNAKERAENLMIVDLMRNDLGRVSEPHSVAVTALFEVEQYATVHQLVSTVTARLEAGVSMRGLLQSAFPGGSMTGAPKIRAMQLIGDLEGIPRGVYSGAAGYLAMDGSADLGMTIRSLVFDGAKVSLGVGGGITIDSDPDAELAETELKAKALLRAIGATNPWA